MSFFILKRINNDIKNSYTHYINKKRHDYSSATSVIKSFLKLTIILV